MCVFGVQGLWRFGFVCFRLGYSGCCKPSGLGFGVWSVSVGCFDCSGLVRRGARCGRGHRWSYIAQDSESTTLQFASLNQSLTQRSEYVFTQ